MNKLFITLFFLSALLYTSFSQDNLLKESTRQEYYILKDSIEKYISCDPSKSLVFANKAIVLINQINDIHEKAEFYHNFGYANYSVSNYESAIKYYEQALKLKKRINDTETISNTINNIGLVYFDWADYNNALKYFQKALKINQKNKNIKKEALALHNIGLVHYALKQYDSCLEYYFKTLEIRKKIGDNAGVASTLNNIGNVYYNKTEHEAALDYYKQSLEIKETLGNKRGQGNSLNNIGLIYYELGKYETALKYFKQSLKIKEEIRNKKGIASTYTNIGNVYMATGQDQKAISYFKKSLQISDSLNLITDIIENYKSLSEIYEKQNNYKVSFDYFKLFHYYRDSLNNANAKIQISDLKTKYTAKENEHKIEILEIEKKIDEEKLKKRKNQLNILLLILILGIVVTIFILIQYRQKAKTNKLLDAQNKKLMDINKKLKESEVKLFELNASKDKFFSIVSHDLKTPFNALLGFTELLSMKSTVLNDEKREKYNDAIYKSSRQLFNLLDNLLKWSQAQTNNITNQPEVYQLKELVEENIELVKILAVEKSVNFTVMIENTLQFYADRNLVLTIIRNLLVNAIKFSKPNGEILISATENYNFVSISIQDFGIGISNNDIEKLFKIDEKLCIEGTLQEKGTGLGLIICNDFIKIIGGKISVESKEGKGSKFTFTLPVKQG